MRSNEALGQLILTVDALLDALDALAKMSGRSWALHDTMSLASQEEFDALSRGVEAAEQRYAQGLSKAKELLAPLQAILIIEEKGLLRETE